MIQKLDSAIASGVFYWRLECTDFIEWEETENYWANNATIWDSAKAVSGIPRIGTFAVIARDE